MAPGESFHYDIEETEDENQYLTTVIRYHGRLISENTAEIRALVGPMIVRGGHIILDFTDLEYLDSSGLGAIVSLKVSSINRGLSKLEMVHLKPRVRKLLTLTNLLQLFSE
jgi:anti-sigma B factor antagonist